MSNSVFKEYPSDAYEDDDENLKIDSNLVILVNKNGSVSVDQRSLRNILVNKDTTNASVSVVRVVSPTPSLQDEIDADMKNSTLENEIFGSDTEDEDSKVETGKVDTTDGGDAKSKLPKQTLKLDGDDAPHVCLTVENFYPPGEANKFADEVLGLAGITNPLSLDIVDYDFQRYVIQNDHCYTPLTSPSQQLTTRPLTSTSPLPESAVDGTAVATGSSTTAEKALETNSAPVTPTEANVKKTRSGRSVKKPAKLAKIMSLKKKQIEEPEEDVDNEDDADSTEDLLQHLEDSDSEFSEYATSSSPDDDDDSDADFDVNYRKKSRFSSGSASKKTKAKQAAAKIKMASKVSKKRPSHSTSGVDAEMEGILKEIESTPPAKEPTVVKKKLVKQEPKKPVVHLPTAGGTTKALKVTPLHQKTAKPKQVIIESVIVVQPPKVAPVPTPTPKKEVKKPAPHVEAALFSDMTSLFSTPDIIKKVGDKSNKAGPSGGGFVALTPTNVKANRHLLNQQISVHTHSRTASEQEKNELELIDSIVKEELKMANTVAATPATNTSTATSTAMMNENIPNIVKMLENQSDMGATDNLLGDLGGDALPDDLLQHVAAELAANKDLQDIIDTQVLGVQNLQSMSTVIPVSATTATTVTGSAAQSHQVAKAVVDVSNLPSASKIMKDLHRKDPIKIVRSDGRVITLPPIEAPATRASKRRAQNTSETEQSPQVSSSQSKIALTAVAKEKLDVLKKENSADEVAAKAGPAVITVCEPLAATPVAEAAIIAAIGDGIDDKRRNSLGGSKAPVDPLALTPKEAAGRSSRRQSTVSAVLTAYPDMDDIDSDESWNSEDDPDRLWCICKQPHNNRFMICCDVCEDWFHGKCVNITKAMGQQMEDKGIEWTCPNCIKKKQAGVAKGDGTSAAFKTQQTKLTDFMAKSSTPGGTSCITCSAKARPNSIYCSDDCILKHAKNTTGGSGHSKLKMPGEKLKKPAPPNATLMKNKNNRVVVFEPNSGRCLAGPSAPTSENLKQWLKDHPTFEVVVPGSEQAKAIRNKQLQLKQLSKDMAAKRQEPDLFTQPAKIQTQLKIGESKNLIIVKSAPQQQQSPVASPTTAKPTVKSSPKPPATPKSSPVTPRQPRKQSTGEGSSKNIFASQSKSEPPIRESVKKTLEEQLTNRLNQDTAIMRMSAEDITRFAQLTEKEMYLLFNKDTGVKYKAKYRSLVFNIKDTKNQTLIKNIADKSIRPYDLVRMSPEELASKELAKWRENENKHSLEMIKKSELDMLACAKNYVLKTHKGEEVIESRDTDMIDIDKNVSVEDVVTVLNSSAVSSTSEFVDVPEPHQQTAAEREAAYVKSYQSQTSTSSTTSTSKKKKDSKESSHRSRSRETDHHKSSSSTSSSSKHKRKRSRERSRERDHKKSHDRRKDEKHEKHGASSNKEKSGVKHHHKEETKKEPERPAPKVPRVVKVAAPKPEDYNLIDKILESSSTLPKATDEAPTPNVKPQPVKLTAVASTTSLVESDQEPTSTVIIPTPPHKAFDKDDDIDVSGDDPPQISPIDSSEDDDAAQQPILWTGTIKMFDVASFHVTAQRVSGDTDDIIVDLPAAMDIVGRISPETVWEYISKIRKSPNKEILILRLSSLDTAGYFTLYSYMETRKRLGVVKTTSHVIKDFYVMPLPSHKLLPSVLLPINGPGFVEGVDKPDLLLGIVVKTRLTPKKVGDLVAISSSSVKVSRKKASAQVTTGSFTPPHKSGDGSFTPPSSPKAARKATKRTGSKLTIGLPTVSASKFVPAAVPEPNPEEDMDEPYSPGGSDDEDGAVLSALPKALQPPTTTVLTTSMSTTTVAVKPVVEGAGPSARAPDDDLQRKMEEINRQIEASKMEIAGIAGILTKGGDNSSNMEEAFFSSTAIPALDRIALPSNLSEILASIKHVTNPAPPNPANEPITIDDDSDDVEEYVPTASFVSVDQISSYHPSATGSGFTQNTRIQAGEVPTDGQDADESAAEVPPANDASTGPSRLAQLTEAELLSMVPDDVLLDAKADEEPPAPKKSRFDEPPPPGLEEEEA